MVTQDAFDGSQVPLPASDFRSSWMYNDAYYADYPVVGESRELYIDTPVQRRVPAGSTLAFMLETNAGSGAAVIWGLANRVLYAVK